MRVNLGLAQIVIRQSFRIMRTVCAAQMFVKCSVRENLPQPISTSYDHHIEDNGATP